MPRVQVVENEVVRDNPHRNVCTGTVYSEGVQEQLDQACAMFGFKDNRWVTGKKAHLDCNGNWVAGGGTIANFGKKEYDKAMSYRYKMPPTKYQSGLKPDAIPVTVKSWRPGIDKKTGKRIIVPTYFTVYNVTQTDGVIGNLPGQLPK